MILNTLPIEYNSDVFFSFNIDQYFVIVFNVIVSHSKRFVFFKPIKTAGTSIECSLWDICNKNIDIYTGSALKSEISSKDFNFLPANNWHQEKILNREEGLDYFKKHKKYNLINSLLDNSDIKNIRIVSVELNVKKVMRHFILMSYQFLNFQVGHM